MEKIDYEGAWKELYTRGIPTEGGQRVYYDLVGGMNEIKKRHTTWEPENGEWVYMDYNNSEFDSHIRHPVRYSGGLGDKFNLERGYYSPLHKHLPIQEYIGFKIGEKVKSKIKDTQYTVTGFKFEKGENAKILLDYISHNLEVYQYEVDIDSIEHLPPEPEEPIMKKGKWDHLKDILDHCSDPISQSGLRAIISSLELEYDGRHIDMDWVMQKCKARLEGVK